MAEAAKLDAQDLIVIAHYKTPAEAELAKEVLENEGIEAFLGNELAVGVMPYLSGTLGSVSLQVQRQDRQRARELLTPPGELEPPDSTRM